MIWKLRKVISTYSGGIPEYIGGGAAQLLNRDVTLDAQIAKAIKKIIENKEYGHYCASLGIKKAKTLSSSQYIDRFMKLII